MITLTQKKIKTLILAVTLSFFLPTIVIDAAAKPIATLTKFYGEVYVKTKKKNDWITVRKGQLFYEGDRVKSNEDGKAEIYFSNGSQIILSPDSEMEFNPIDKKQRKKRSIFMRSGKSYNKVTSGTPYEVESVYAVAAVKGTGFNLSVEGDITTLDVEEGLVDFKNKKTNKMIPAGPNTSSTATETSLSQIEQKFPGKEKLEDIYDIDLKVNQTPRSGELFSISIKVKDIKTQELISIKEKLKIETPNKELNFYNKGNLEKSFTLDLNNGSTNVQAIAEFQSTKEKEYAVIITGDGDVQGSQLKIKVLPALSEKVLYFEFLDNNNKKRKIEMFYKKIKK